MTLKTETSRAGCHKSDNKTLLGTPKLAMQHNGDENICEGALLFSCAFVFTKYLGNRLLYISVCLKKLTTHATF